MTLRRVAPYLVPYFPQIPTFLVWLPYYQQQQQALERHNRHHHNRARDRTIVIKTCNKLKTIKYLSDISQTIKDRKTFQYQQNNWRATEHLLFLASWVQQKNRLATPCVWLSGLVAALGFILREKYVTKNEAKITYTIPKPHNCHSVNIFKRAVKLKNIEWMEQWITLINRYDKTARKITFSTFFSESSLFDASASLGLHRKQPNNSTRTRLMMFDVAITI